MIGKWSFFSNSITPFTFISWHSSKEQLFPSSLLFTQLLFLSVWTPGFVLFYNLIIIIIYFDGQIVLIWPLGTPPLQTGSCVLLTSFYHLKTLALQFNSPFNNFPIFNNSLFSLLQKLSLYESFFYLLVIDGRHTEKRHTKRGIF